ESNDSLYLLEDINEGSVKDNENKKKYNKYINEIDSHLAECIEGIKQELEKIKKVKNTEAYKNVVILSLTLSDLFVSYPYVFLQQQKDDNKDKVLDEDEDEDDQYADWLSKKKDYKKINYKANVLLLQKCTKDAQDAVASVEKNTSSLILASRTFNMKPLQKIIADKIKKLSVS
ncbi:MAG: hypothetical protein EZS28_048384, partial [Streblomastix strix]